MQLDYLRKELINTYEFSNVRTNRNYLAKEIVNGRTIYVEGELCAWTIIGLLYKVYNPSKKTYNLVLHVGYARQGNANTKPNPEEEYERAYVMALENPLELVFDSMNYNVDISWNSMIQMIMQQIGENKFVLTPEELHQLYTNTKIERSTFYGLHPINDVGHMEYTSGKAN